MLLAQVLQENDGGAYTHAGPELELLQPKLSHHSTYTATFNCT